jgi:hypothetical protein
LAPDAIARLASSAKQAISQSRTEGPTLAGQQWNVIVFLLDCARGSYRKCDVGQLAADS